jgi:hypothetical protein
MEILTKIFSREFFSEMGAFIMELFGAETSDSAKLAKAIEHGVAIIEKFDDSVTQIPAVGWILKLLVDNPATDDLQRRAVTVAVELIVATLRPTLPPAE